MPEIRKLLLSEAFVIAAISFYGYCLSLAYGAGYNFYFNIPWYFAPFNLVSIIVAVFFVASGLGLVWWLLKTFELFGLIKNDTPANRQRTTLFVICAFIAVGLYLVHARVGLWLVCAFLLALSAGPSFILPLIPTKGRTKGLTYNEKLVAYAQEQSELEKNHLTSQLQSKVDRNVLSVFFLLLAIIFLATLSGYASAENQTVFEVISTEPPMVILQYTGSEFLASTYDERTKELGETVFLITTEDLSQKGYSLTSTKIGPLIPTNPAF